VIVCDGQTGKHNCHNAWCSQWLWYCAILTQNELVLTFRGSYVCANFGENRKKCDRESARRRIHWQTDANRFYNLSRAICYSYGTDKKCYNIERKRISLTRRISMVLRWHQEVAGQWSSCCVSSSWEWSLLPVCGSIARRWVMNVLATQTRRHCIPLSFY